MCLYAVKQGSACSGCSPGNTSGCKIGDLLFYCTSQPCPSHVVMYIGGGRVAECPHAGTLCSWRLLGFVIPQAKLPV